MRYRTLAITLAVGFLPGVAGAQETASDTLLTVDHYLDLEQVSEPRLSPDGSQVVYTRSWVNRLEDKWESALWIVNADGTKNRFLTRDPTPAGPRTDRGSPTSPTASPRAPSCSSAGWMPKAPRRR